MLFCEKMKAMREERGLSLKDLSGMTGISEATLERIEQGNALPNLEGLLSICRAMEVTPNDILLDISFDGQKGRQESNGERLCRAENEVRSRSFDEKVQYVLSIKQSGKEVYTALIQRKLGVSYEEAKELVKLACT